MPWRGRRSLSGCPTIPNVPSYHDVRDRLSPHELEQTCREIDRGLHRMLDFEKQLQGYDKETLCLMLTLTADPENHQRILRLLDNLAPLCGDKSHREK